MLYFQLFGGISGFLYVPKEELNYSIRIAYILSKVLNFIFSISTI
jgi:hypothetical protein